MGVVGWRYGVWLHSWFGIPAFAGMTDGAAGNDRLGGGGDEWGHGGVTSGSGGDEWGWG